MRKYILAILLLASLPVFSRAATFSDDFDGYANLTAVGAVWDIDPTNMSLETTGCRSGKCLKINLSASGTQQMLTRSLNESEFYIRYYAKRVNFGTTGGHKNLKVFGERSGDNYANITFTQIYQTGLFYNIQTGDGTGITNDSQCPWYYAAHSLDCSGTAVTTTSNFEMADDTWYAIEFHIKPNDNGASNSVLQAWVDGTLRLHYTDFKMRNDANVNNFTMISFVDYVGAVPDSAYEWWIDDVVVATTGPIGLAGGADTMPNTFSLGSDNTSVELNTVIYAPSSANVAGIDDNCSISITGTGCQYQVNGAGDWLTSGDNVSLNDNVAVRTTSSGSYSTSISCTLTMGGVSDSWAAVTKAATVEEGTAKRSTFSGMSGGWK